MSARMKKSSGKSVAQKSPRKSHNNNSPTSPLKRNSKRKLNINGVKLGNNPKRQKLDEYERFKRIKLKVYKPNDDCIIRPKGLPVILTSSIYPYEKLEGFSFGFNKDFPGIDAHVKVVWSNKITVNKKTKNGIKKVSVNEVTWNRIYDADSGDFVYNADVTHLIKRIFKYYFFESKIWMANIDNYIDSVCKNKNIVAVSMEINKNNRPTHSYGIPNGNNGIKWINEDKDEINLTDGERDNDKLVLTQIFMVYFKIFIQKYTHDVFAASKKEKNVYVYWKSMFNIFKYILSIYNVCLYIYNILYRIIKR